MSAAARLRLFYFLYYGAVGANLPYLSAYLRGLGFSGAELGAAQMVGPAVAGPAALAWAIAADRLGAPARALRWAALLAFASMAALPLVRTPAGVAAVLLGQGLFGGAVVPLVDAVTIEWVRTQAALSYARIRLFGSLGFIALAVGLGFALDLRGGLRGDPIVPLAIVACVGGFALVARVLPALPTHGAPPRLGDFSGLLRDRRLVLLLLGCAAHWAACAPFHLLFGVFVRDAGLPARITGLGMLVGVTAEVAALVAFPRLERRFGLTALFGASFGGSAVRWLLLSRAESAAAVVSIQVLHGLTFGTFWGASITAMARAVPARLRATGQALFSAIVFAGGNAVGYWLAGTGYDVLGGVPPLYACAAGVEAVLLIGTYASSGRRNAGRHASSRANADPD